MTGCPHVFPIQFCLEKQGSGVCWVHEPWSIRGGGTARLTSAGLLIERPGQVPECWGWMELEFRNGQWAERVDASGQPVPGTRICVPRSRCAASLHAMAVRRLCRGDGWTIEDRLGTKSFWLDGIGAAVFAGVLPAMVALVGLVMIVVQYKQFGTVGVTSANAALIVLGVIAILACAWCVHNALLALWTIRLNNARRIALSAHGVRVSLKSGETIEQQWSNVALRRTGTGVALMHAGDATVPPALLRKTAKAIVASRAWRSQTATTTARRLRGRNVVVWTILGVIVSVLGVGLLSWAGVAEATSTPVWDVAKILTASVVLCVGVLAIVLLGRWQILRGVRDHHRTVRRFRAALGPDFPAGAEK